MSDINKEEIQKCLNILGFDCKISISLLKRRYKELCKDNHPDLHHSDKKQNLSEINGAYNMLLEYLENIEIDLMSNNLKNHINESELWDKKFGLDFFFGGTK